MKPRNVIILLAAVLATGSVTASNWAVWQDNSTRTYLDDAIAAGGGTVSTISDLSTGSLSSLDGLILLNSSNGSFSNSINVFGTDIASFVSNGGFVIFYDRWVNDAALDAFLPGNVDFNFVRSFINDNNIDLASEGGSSPYYAGISDTSFDWGISSSHGYVELNGLGSSTAFLSRGGEPSKITEFEYAVNSGAFRYSTIPADYHLNGFGFAPNVAASIKTVITNTVANYSPVPEPSTVSVLLGMVGVFWIFRCRRVVVAE